MKQGRKVHESYETPFNNMVISTTDVVDPLLNKIGAYPNFLTMLSFVLELNGVQKLNVGRWKESVISILIGRILDVYDGNYARRHKKVTEFGGQLDTITDLIAFVLLWYVLISRYGNKKCSVVLVLLVFMFIFSKINAGCKEKHLHTKGTNFINEQFKSWCNIPNNEIESFLQKSKWLGTNHVYILMVIIIFMFETNRIS